MRICLCEKLLHVTNRFFLAAVTVCRSRDVPQSFLQRIKGSIG